VEVRDDCNERSKAAALPHTLDAGRGDDKTFFATEAADDLDTAMGSMKLDEVARRRASGCKVPAGARDLGKVMAIVHEYQVHAAV